MQIHGWCWNDAPIAIDFKIDVGHSLRGRVQDRLALESGVRNPCVWSPPNELAFKMFGDVPGSMNGRLLGNVPIVEHLQ